MSRSISSVALLLLGFTTFAIHASANTYVVDSSGGGQFTDIPPAIAAAQPGDVLLVMQGVYSGFTLDKGLAIIGYGTVRVLGDATVAGVPASQTAALVHLAPNSLFVSGCAGSVLAQDFAPVKHIGVLQSRDVRLRHVDSMCPNGATSDAADVTGSRVEFVNSLLNGSNGGECAPGIDGGTALNLVGASRVQLARSNAYGGNGAYCFDQPYPPFYGGNGGTGITISASSTVYLTGNGDGHVSGGGGGPNFFYDTCQWDGSSAVGIVVADGATLWYSGVTIYGPPSEVGIHCIDFPGVPIAGSGQVTHAMPDDPSLDVSGTATAGRNLTFIVRARAGSTAILYFGRSAVVITDPNTQIEQLTQKSRIVSLGAIPAGGQATFTWPIASGSRAGTLFVAQAEVTISPSDVRHTNSIPIVLR
jgi:hypothetical protein